LILAFFLHFFVLVYGFRVEKQSSSIINSIIPYSVEIRLSVWKKRNVNFASSHTFVSAHCLHLFAIIAKRDILSHKIYFAYNGQKLDRWYWELSIDSNCNLFLLLENFILQSDSFFFLIKHPPWLIELLVVVYHLSILGSDGVDEQLAIWRYFHFFSYFLYVLRNPPKSFIYIVLSIASFNFLPNFFNLINRKRNWGL